jgi:hypothetical protein
MLGRVAPDGQGAQARVRDRGHLGPPTHPRIAEIEIGLSRAPLAVMLPWMRRSARYR